MSLRILAFILALMPATSRAQGLQTMLLLPDSVHLARSSASVQIRPYVASAYLLDAALNSLNSLSSLVKKENYRNRVTAFNNPASADMGFSLEAELQASLRPILEKTRSTNTDKFSGVLSSIINGGRTPGTAGPAGGIFPAIISLVGDLAVREKRVERADVDSFLQVMGRYFAQYEKLQTANNRFEEQVARLNGRLQELHFDIREYTIDLVTLVHRGPARAGLRGKTIEELLLLYLDVPVLDSIGAAAGPALPAYPTDGVKGAKDISSTLQKLFGEYQKIYKDNYTEIRAILSGGRSLGKSINATQLETSLRELDELYQESGKADVLNLRVQTLQERLRALVTAEGAARAGGR
ncbi:hypothetical protein [Flaviaesturariibacter amylovorans]|uniref:Uncharacterized protein n=1 Tax=Flaviaesturariibacter amylovorans TaxID=1084520 RepID=A0ABP8G958_9BACT